MIRIENNPPSVRPSNEPVFIEKKMARLARLVVPGVPHHITQRGNRRQIVFFSDSDKSLYLKILSETKAETGFSILSYCLMNNHLHLIAIPETKDDFAEIFGETHRKYTTLINLRESWKGHLWQGRFGSCPMEEPHLYNAAKYVERNPVRAGLVEKAEQYAWSSARGHLGLWTDPLLDRDCGAFLDFGNWRSYLAGKDDEYFVDDLKRHERTGRPFGPDDFLTRIEALTGRKIKKQKPGRKMGLPARLVGVDVPN